MAKLAKAIAGPRQVARDDRLRVVRLAAAGSARCTCRGGGACARGSSSRANLALKAAFFFKVFIMAKIDVWPLLSKDMQDIVARSQAVTASLPPLGHGHPMVWMRRVYTETQRLWYSDEPAVQQIEEQVWDSGHGEIALRLYLPKGAAGRPPILYLHGGGWIVGSLDTHDTIMRRLAAASCLPVIGVDYSLAPEKRFPTQILQIAAVVRALPAVAKRWPVSPEAYAFAGDSAGANLAVGATVELQAGDAVHPPLPWALLLYYGVFGLRDAMSRRLYGGDLDGLSEKEIDFFRDCYNRDPELQRDPRCDVLAADLSAMPPSYLGAVALDPLLDDSLAMARLLEAAGREVTLVRYEGVLHGFLKYAAELEAARQALTDGGAFLARHCPAA